ncbi:MAG: Na+-transporting NADH:ubiquinone oxidoreductase subunit D, partial [Clostridia bacterium]|nr:Na+-transporting NADH:ubiquinone oxidoreductase subunit D [Clostridia bacterium]
VLSGGMLFGAIFMATDYTTSPMTHKGQALYAIGCGLLTCLIRNFGAYPEGVTFAILLMNIATPLIDKYVKGGKVYGKGKK